MKKTIIPLILLIVFNSHINSQSIWKIAFKVGPTFSKTGINYSNGNEKYGLGISSGFDFYRFKRKHLFFKTGINYNLKTVKQTNIIHYVDSSLYDTKTNLHQLTIPLLLGYRFNIKQHSFYIASGIEINYAFSSHTQVEKEHSYLLYPNTVSSKYVIGLAYLNRLNDHYTLIVNPEYAGNISSNETVSLGEAIISWRMNFGIIYKF